MEISRPVQTGRKESRLARARKKNVELDQQRRVHCDEGHLGRRYAVIGHDDRRASGDLCLVAYKLSLCRDSDVFGDAMDRQLAGRAHVNRLAGYGAWNRHGSCGKGGVRKLLEVELAADNAI